MLLGRQVPYVYNQGQHCSAKGFHNGRNRSDLRRPANKQLRRFNKTILQVFGALATGKESVNNAEETTQIVALKEWAVTAEALIQGEQTILLRKGGIREPKFKLPAQTFLLFENAFHTDEALLKSSAQQKYSKVLNKNPRHDSCITIRAVADVACLHTIDEPDKVRALDELHIWSDKFIDDRLAWRPKVPFTVLDLRVKRLLEPIVIPNSEHFWGCFSFIDIDLSASELEIIKNAVPVLDEGSFSRKQRSLQDMLQQHE